MWGEVLKVGIRGQQGGVEQHSGGRYPKIIFAHISGGHSCGSRMQGVSTLAKRVQVGKCSRNFFAFDRERIERMQKKSHPPDFSFPPV